MMKTHWPLRCYTLLFLLLTLITPISSETSLEDDVDRFINPSEDYDDVFDDKKKATTPSPPDVDLTMKPCYEDICNDLPGACHELQQKHHCSCPGVAQGPSALPETPVVMVWSSSGGGAAAESLEVRWCAAHSPNTNYRVLVGGREVGLFGELKRSMLGLRGVSGGQEVCVQAENEVGRSPLEGMACRVYEPPRGSPGLALRMGLIGGGVALALLILIVALLLWRRNSRRKDMRARGHAGPL
ncbi:leucine-rich repeat neuronal protein 4 [Engraulis encrasicolus]|uniref:leucine-rich repeat neuronal protein 4 n=1 Tax=Engraulis encrasicolus TaxID=184585 RepID=UPI002FD144F0